nr:hypothetical protein Iba_chr08aCG7180 [Ipomoea batatas]
MLPLRSNSGVDDPASIRMSGLKSGDIAPDFSSSGASLCSETSFRSQSKSCLSGSPLAAGSAGISGPCFISLSLQTDGGRSNNSFLRFDKEAKVDATATVEGSPDLASKLTPFTGPLWASKMLTEGGMLAADMSSLEYKFSKQGSSKRIKKLGKERIIGDTKGSPPRGASGDFSGTGASGDFRALAPSRSADRISCSADSGPDSFTAPGVFSPSMSSVDDKDSVAYKTVEGEDGEGRGRLEEEELLLVSTMFLNLDLIPQSIPELAPRNQNTKNSIEED